MKYGIGIYNHTIRKLTGRIFLLLRPLFSLGALIFSFCCWFVTICCLMYHSLALALSVSFNFPKICESTSDLPFFYWKGCVHNNQNLLFIYHSFVVYLWNMAYHIIHHSFNFNIATNKVMDVHDGSFSFIFFHRILYAKGANWHFPLLNLLFFHFFLFNIKVKSHQLINASFFTSWLKKLKRKKRKYIK